MYVYMYILYDICSAIVNNEKREICLHFSHPGETKTKRFHWAGRRTQKDTDTAFMVHFVKKQQVWDTD